MTLQHITLALAAFAALIALWSLASPASWRAAIKAYPRWQPAGWALVVIDMVWFGLNIKATPLSTFDEYKRYLWFVVAAIVFLLIRYLGELLAARALGGLMLLIPGALFDASRVDYDTPCRLVAVVVGYIIAVAGCFIVAGPHRFRTWMARPISNDGNARTFGAVSLFIAIALGAIALLCYAPRVP